MSAAGLRDLLDFMRQHPCFPELLSAVEAPKVKHFRRSKEGGDVADQQAEWIFKSGQNLQHDNWRWFLTEFDPLKGEIIGSQKEKS